MSGDCDIQDDCVSSTNYPRQYGNSDVCSVTMLQDAFVLPGDVFDLEWVWGVSILIINGAGVEKEHLIPNTLKAGDIISWDANMWVQREWDRGGKGWQLCFQEMITPVPTHPPSISTISFRFEFSQCQCIFNMEK